MTVSRPGVEGKGGDDLLSHTVTRAVPSARRGLTSVFGMGTGRTLSLSSPPKGWGVYSLVAALPPKGVSHRDDGRRRAGVPNYCGGQRCSVSGGQDERTISTGQLNTLLCLHLLPINEVVFLGSSGRVNLEGGFPLRCFQRLSRPHVATLPCRWRDNRYTRGASIPVLSY